MVVVHGYVPALRRKVSIDHPVLVTLKVTRKLKDGSTKTYNRYMIKGTHKSSKGTYKVSTFIKEEAFHNLKKSGLPSRVKKASTKQKVTKRGTRVHKKRTEGKKSRGYNALSKSELLDIAKARNITGRHKMSRDELVITLRAHRGPRMRNRPHRGSKTTAQLRKEMREKALKGRSKHKRRSSMKRALGY